MAAIPRLKHCLISEVHRNDVSLSNKNLLLGISWVPFKRPKKEHTSLTYSGALTWQIVSIWQGLAFLKIWQWCQTKIFFLQTWCVLLKSLQKLLKSSNSLFQKQVERWKGRWNFRPFKNRLLCRRISMNADSLFKVRLRSFYKSFLSI